MKRLLLVLLFIIGVSSAYAAELKVSGDMMVQGNHDNIEYDGADAEGASFFEYDLNINAALVANEAATVIVKLTYDREGTGTVADGTDISTETAEEDGALGDHSHGITLGEGLAVERAYINYKIAPFLQLNTGLMGGGKWASNFSDTEINVTRVQFIAALSADMVFIGTYEKNDEADYDVMSVEKNDTTTYYLCASLGFGPIRVLPLFKYQENGAYHELGSDLKTMAFDLGINGNFGMISLVSEFVYAKVDMDGLTPDDKVMYGAYVDIAANVDPAKVGVALAYGSSDEDKGSFAWGADLDFTVVVDDLYFGSEAGLEGMTAFKVYAEVKPVEKLTAGAAFVYGMSTNDKALKWNGSPDTTTYSNLVGTDVSFWEVDASLNYAFDANASYEVGGGYANITNDSSVGTFAAAYGTQTAYRVYNKFSVKF